MNRNLIAGRMVKGMNNKEVEMSEPVVTVSLEEEYGYRRWVWGTGMTASELTAWWSGLKSVSPYFFSPVGLPGEMVQVVDDSIEIICSRVTALREDKGLTSEECEKRIDEAIRTTPHRFVSAETGDPVEVLGVEQGWWTGHIHQDDDSRLRTPEGRSIYHAGHTEMNWHNDEESDNDR